VGRNDGIADENAPINLKASSRNLVKSEGIELIKID